MELPGVVTHASNPSPQKAEAGEFLQNLSQLRLQGESLLRGRRRGGEVNLKISLVFQVRTRGGKRSFR